ncbi:hypothetical protein [Aureliella helgolandensis]|nr:hypothetical protein [Aureliella helgolandensis]
MQFHRPTQSDGHALYSNSIRCDAFTVRVLGNCVSKEIVGGSDEAIVGLKVVNQCIVPTSARIDGFEAVQPIIDRPENKVKVLVERWLSSVSRGTTRFSQPEELTQRKANRLTEGLAASGCSAIVHVQASFAIRG